MKFWISALVFILTFGLGKCATNNQSILLITSESIIGIDLDDKSASSNSKELRVVDVNAIVSYDLSDTENINQEVMFNSSTYPNVNVYTEDFNKELAWGRNYITGMTVDPITSTTYFTTTYLISVMNSKKEWRTLIEFDDVGEALYTIKHICLMSSENRLYWLSNRTNLYSSYTDGSDIRKLRVDFDYEDFSQMVADDNKKILYLLSDSGVIVVVNTNGWEYRIYEKDIRSIAVDSKTGDVFITKFDAIKNETVLKKFNPLEESPFSIPLPGNPSKHFLVVHRKDENWTECKDCDSICVRSRDKINTCVCPHDLIRDRESGKCKTPERRFFFLSLIRRIVTIAWPDITIIASLGILFASCGIRKITATMMLLLSEVKPVDALYQGSPFDLFQVWGEYIAVSILFLLVVFFARKSSILERKLKNSKVDGYYINIRGLDFTATKDILNIIGDISYSEIRILSEARKSMIITFPFKHVATIAKAKIEKNQSGRIYQVSGVTKVK